jgi:hypothetical protein
MVNTGDNAPFPQSLTVNTLMAPDTTSGKKFTRMQFVLVPDATDAPGGNHHRG